METEARGGAGAGHKARCLAQGLVPPNLGLESGAKDPAASEPRTLDLTGGDAVTSAIAF